MVYISYTQEFDVSVRTFARTSTNTEVGGWSLLHINDSESIGNADYITTAPGTGSAFGSERDALLAGFDQYAARMLEATTETSWQSHPEWSAEDRAFADNAMDALSLTDPSGTIAEHTALTEHFVKARLACELWQQGSLGNDSLLQVLKETNAAFEGSPADVWTYRVWQSLRQ